jgi:LPPG:FO 2-phospho-L-lactate transferase
VSEALESADRVIIAPSNPYVSIGPMLALPGMRAALKAVRDKTVAVSPLIRHRAVRGPLAGMMKSLGAAGGTRGIADYYSGLASTLVVSPGDVPATRGAGWPELLEQNILLDTRRRSLRLARFLLEAAPGGRVC